MIKKYTVQTLNVCFEAPDTFEVRFKHLVQSLLTHLPAIVCLQEVTKDLLTHLQSGLGNLYTMSPPPPPYVDYYTVILCRKELRAKYARLPFHQSAMMRDLLVARFDIPDLKNLAVATTHLESLDSHDLRELQMKEIARILDPVKHALLLGDFNFCSYRNYDERRKAPLQNASLLACLPEYVDQWPVLHGGEEMGYTFDDARNQWKFSRAYNSKNKFRFDRIMAKLPQESSIALADMRLVYDEPVARVNEPVPCKVYVSDHLGLEITIVCKNAAVAEAAPMQANKTQRIHEEEEVICLDDDEEEEEVALPVEPKQGEASVAIRLVLSNGKSQVQRSFAPDTPIRTLRLWAMSADASLGNGRDFSIVQMPSGKEITTNDSLTLLDRSTVRVIVK